MELLHHDTVQTIKNRQRLLNNKNLLLWYRKLYQLQFAGLGDISNKVILEIGSGTSPLKMFYKNVLTSDLMDLDHLDYNFDCQMIDKFELIKDHSIDIISLTNVLHHLKDPIAFLIKANSKLKSDGLIIMLEPYFSFLSAIIYKYLHHEPVIFDIDKPMLSEIKGPLSSANMAIPYLIFFSTKDWAKKLEAYYKFSKKDIFYYSSLSYMITGGISRRIPLPFSLYNYFHKLDNWLAQKLPHLFAAYFIIKLRRRG